MTTIEVHGFLAHARSAAFERQLREARGLIRVALSQARRPYIAWSSGKDSTVVAELVWAQDPTVPAIYFDAQCALPGSERLFARLRAAGRPLERWPTEQPFLDLLAAAGGPDAPGVEAATMEGTVYAPLRRLLAERHYDAVFLGLRAEESSGRFWLIRLRGLRFANARDGVLEVLPVGRWRYADIWAAIVSQGWDWNEEYRSMLDLPERERRISYWAGETNRRYGRWVWLRQHHPQLFNQFVTRFPEVARFT